MLPPDPQYVKDGALDGSVSFQVVWLFLCGGGLGSPAMLLAGSGGWGSAVGGIWCAGQRLPVIVSPTAGGFTQSFAPMVREPRFKGAATQRGGSRCWPVRPYSRKHWTRGLHDAGMRFCADWPLTTGLTSGWTENHVTGYSIGLMFAVVKGGLSVGRGKVWAPQNPPPERERYPSPNPLPLRERALMTLQSPDHLKRNATQVTQSLDRRLLAPV